MTQKEQDNFIKTILEQQATILKLREKIKYLYVLIDSLSCELEKARKEGKL